MSSSENYEGKNPVLNNSVSTNISQQTYIQVTL